MKERVTYEEHLERETFAESFLWKSYVKTIPELQHPIYSKCCRISALKNMICLNLKS